MAENAVKESFRVSGEDLRCHGRRAGVAKAVAVELCCRLTGRSQREVARYFGYRSESAAGKQRRLVQVQLAGDKKLAGRIANIESVVRKGISKKHTNE